MNGIGQLLIAFGILSLVVGNYMYGDIGLAAQIGGSSALFSGIGILLGNKRLKALEERFIWIHKDSVDSIDIEKMIRAARGVKSDV